MSDNIGVSNTSPDQWTSAISASSRTMRDVSTRVPTFGERSEHTREYSITDAVSDSDSTDNTPSLDPGCRDGNATHLCMNTSAGPGLTHEVSFAVDVINRVQLAITSVGFFANAATYLTLKYNGDRFSPLILGVRDWVAVLFLPDKKIVDWKSYVRCHGLPYLAQSDYILDMCDSQRLEPRFDRRRTLHQDMQAIRVPLCNKEAFLLQFRHSPYRMQPCYLSIVH